MAQWTHWWDAYPVAWAVVPGDDNADPPIPSVEVIVFTDQVADEGSHLRLANPASFGSHELSWTPPVELSGSWAAMNPTWLPDRTRLAFVAWPSDDYTAQRVIVADVSVDPMGQLTLSGAVDITQQLDDAGVPLPSRIDYLQWSTTSNSRFAFSTVSTTSNQGQSDVWVVDLGAARPNLRRLPNVVEGQARYQPSWSPDDSQIVYWANRAGRLREGNYRVALDGSGGPRLPRIVQAQQQVAGSGAQGAMNGAGRRSPRPLRRSASGRGLTSR